jgi:poly-gamma-glutamate synthase PgsB/CapB
MNAFDRFLESWRSWGELWFSPGGNTLAQLGVLLALVGLWLAWLFVSRQYCALRDRKKIPLVVGGWGTRGKSGSERKKAALFNALGFRMLSKSTGCEAMFVTAHDYEESREYYLFRPHDKATIWEQCNVLNVAANMKADVMLWECMALQADYVRILQQSWMTDDISTITNTYPDHEDIQGPSGFEVSEAIANFIGNDATVIHSEQHFQPVLREVARKRGSRLIEPDSEMADLLTPDVLERFPYTVHPKNLALAFELGAQLGLTDGFCIKEIADHLVPDLGVLKTYPEVFVAGGRGLRFSNGCSANERAGTMNNWRRLKLDDPDRDRREWVVMVVNNRADRVPRSKVFASIIVDDLAGHRFVLIGSNLNGLNGYIEEALAARLQRLTLPADKADQPAFLENVLARDAANLRFLCRTHAELAGRAADVLGGDEGTILRAVEGAPQDAESLAAACLTGLPEGTAASEEQISFVRDAAHGFASLAVHRAGLADAISSGDPTALPAWLNNHRTWYRQWFLSSIHTVWNYSIKGPDLIRHVGSLCAPNARVHVLGIQNIKGTGLDFAERWVRQGDIERNLERVFSRDPRQQERGIQFLKECGKFEDFERDLVRRRCDAFLAENPGVEFSVRRMVTDAMALVKGDEEQSLAEKPADASLPGEGAPATPEGQKPATPGAAKPEPPVSFRKRWGRTLAGPTEVILDSFASIWRAHRARVVMKDLSNGRISGKRAVQMLKEVTNKQKGGWLVAKVVGK